jgi:hypothetical protein
MAKPGAVLANSKERNENFIFSFMEPPLETYKASFTERLRKNKTV